MDSVSSNNLGANNLSSTDSCNPPVADKIKTLLNDRGKAFEVHLQERLRSSKTDSDGNLAKTEVPYYMYFDEAHVLTHVDSNTPPPPRSKYHLLGRVLAGMEQRSFFAIFLSTNSWLGAFAPSIYKFQSLRDWDNVILHPPFTELPFDTFADDSFGRLSKVGKGIVRLRDVCTLDHLVQFGRPL